MNNYVKIKVIEEKMVEGQKTRTTQEITAFCGELVLGDVNLNISKINKTHINLEFDESKNPNARFIKTKQFFGKTITIPSKATSINIGDWIDFSDGYTDTRYAIYLSSIYYSKEE